MLLSLRGKLTRASDSEKNGRTTTYVTVADAESLTSIDLSSVNVRAAALSPFVDKLCDIRINIKASKFGNIQYLDALDIQCQPVPAAAAAGAK